LAKENLSPKRALLVETKMIGLKRGTVKLVPHSPEWLELFEREKNFSKIHSATQLSLLSILEARPFQIFQQNQL